MIAMLLALAAPAAAPPELENYRACARMVKEDANRAIASANEWLVKGGSVLARQCLGLAYAELGQYGPAAGAFEQAAREAETARDPSRADFWVQAGNAWLAAGSADRAMKAFDSALATADLTAELRGEVHLDRARAEVALGDTAGARRDLDRAVELVPADPMAWYLSSALALRQNDLKRAQEHAAKAVSLAPSDPDVLVHAGNVAGASGERAAAEGLYMKSIDAAPNSDAARAARAALAANREEKLPLDPQAATPDQLR